MPRAQETVLEINLKALTHNFQYLKSKLIGNQKFLAVVKAFAYGSDAEIIAKHLEDIGVDYFAVAYTHEGVALRDIGITKPILVLHPQPVNFEIIIDRCLEPNLYSFRTLKHFIKIAHSKKQESYPIHIKFNTGLNRLGFNYNQISAIGDELGLTKTVKVKSIFSHLAASEDLNERDFSQVQINKFIRISNSFEKILRYRPTLHMCNTSGILNYPEAHFDMVRSGIGLYGFGNSKEENNNLEPIASLKSVISQIHTIDAGETVGYNRAFLSDSQIKIATIPIGHADGLGRHYGNRNGFVFINSQKAFIIGNVCMDMIMVDVTNINCVEGDEVIIFNSKHSANDLVASVNTISYELITAISQRIKRTVIR